MKTLDDLIEWANEQRQESLRQVDLFSNGGVKAQLVMPDGTTQDITAGVLSHQKANVDAFTSLVSALKR
ncbi:MULTISPECIES: hypothetical protein [Sphingomonas]|uniref:hypothetical protein n=1 Tax=Sphingomonas TaxID=13687 RepID=UPI0012E16A7D|nr:MULTISPECIES: hypothetical protein [Sphingomonas]MDY0968423.1 hypothetical protein [Sphingomonas sp. CFBP9021]USR01558.1 hypothetical protein NEF64_06965 [Sphingomonas aerolata]